MPISTSRKAWTTFIGTASLLLLVEVVRLVRLFRSVKGNKSYWGQLANAPTRQDDFVYLALGDSVANGIGASRPQNGYVSLIAQAIHIKTGRSVHVVNVSVTGATMADVIREQLSIVRQTHADLVTIDIGANDINRGIPEDTFLRDFATILRALPAEKTIVADLPTFERGPKQSTLIRINAKMHDAIAMHNLKLAPIFDVTSASIHDWRTYGADFFHPSNLGHRNWYHAFEGQLDSIIGK